MHRVCQEREGQRRESNLVVLRHSLGLSIELGPLKVSAISQLLSLVSSVGKIDKLGLVLDQLLLVVLEVGLGVSQRPLHDLVAGVEVLEHVEKDLLDLISLGIAGELGRELV